MGQTVPITAIVTAFDRIAQTLETLRRIQTCIPRPAEILVHVDANKALCAEAVSAAFPHLQVLTSENAVGPGGGRNRLVAAARHELIASFDDDSYPLDCDYFARACCLAEAFPNAALFAANIFQRGESVLDDRQEISATGSFGSGGVVFRRSHFLEVGGFVPLVVAYGMEEEDLSIRLLDKGYVLFATPWLRTFHDTDLSHHNSSIVTSRTIANIALLTTLRYPVCYWPYGALQVANRVLWCLRRGRSDGVLSGLASIPRHIASHWHLRKSVSKHTIRRKRALRMLVFKSFVSLRRSFDDPSRPVSAHAHGNAEMMKKLPKSSAKTNGRV